MPAVRTVVSLTGCCKGDQSLLFPGFLSSFKLLKLAKAEIFECGVKRKANSRPRKRSSLPGAQKDFNAQKQAYFQRIADMNLRNPRMIGFGISNKQTFETASAHAAGAIIGSKFVTLLDEEDGDTEKAADKLLEALKN